MPAVPFIAMGLTLVGGIMTYQNQQKAAESTTEANYANAKTIELNAVKEEKSVRTQTRRTLASQRSLYAKAGVDLSSGSPLLIMSESAAEGERNAMNIRWQGVNEGNLMRYYGRQAAKAGNAQAGTTLLTTAGNVAQQYWSYQNA
jgi:hypothetical protein